MPRADCMASLIARYMSENFGLKHREDALDRFNFIVSTVAHSLKNIFFVDRLSHWRTFYITAPHLKSQLEARRNSHSYSQRATYELIMALAKVLHEANLPGYQRLYVEALKHPEIFQRQTHHADRAASL